MSDRKPVFDYSLRIHLVDDDMGVLTTNMMWDPSPETQRKLAEERDAVDKPVVVDMPPDGSARLA